MRLPVASHKTGPVNGKQDRKILNTDVVKHLVIATL